MPKKAPGAGFNDKVAVYGTKLFASIGTFYAFLLFGTLPLIPALSAYRETIQAVSSCLIQLAALPLIACGQVILNRSSERRAEEDHRTIREEFRILNEVLGLLRGLMHEMHAMLNAHPEVLPKDPNDLCEVLRPRLHRANLAAIESIPGLTPQGEVTVTGSWALDPEVYPWANTGGAPYEPMSVRLLLDATFEVRVNAGAWWPEIGSGHSPRSAIEDAEKTVTEAGGYAALISKLRAGG